MIVTKGLLAVSIIMLALLLVALSTATFAWFSSGTSVNIASIAFTASSDSEGGANELILCWDKDNIPASNTDLNFSNPDEIDPTVPLNKPVFDAAYTDFVTNNFFTAAQSTGGEPIRFASSPVATNPAVCKSDNKEYDRFFIVNKSAGAGMMISVSYEISGDNAAALCVAMFVDGKLKGIMTSADEICYGKIVAGAETSSLGKDGEIVRKSGELNFYLDSSASQDGSNIAEIRLVAWYDGNSLTNDGQNLSAKIENVKFTGAYAERP